MVVVNQCIYLGQCQVSSGWQMGGGKERYDHLVTAIAGFCLHIPLLILYSMLGVSSPVSVGEI